MELPCSALCRAKVYTWHRDARWEESTTRKIYFFSLYKILLDKSSVAVRLIGSHLFLAKKWQCILPLIFHPIFLGLLPLQNNDKQRLTFFLSTYPLFFLLDSFPIFPSTFSIFQHRVLTPVQAELLGAVGCVSASERKSCEVQWGARLRPENPGRSWVFLGAVRAVPLVVSADLVLWCASQVAKKCF